MSNGYKNIGVRPQTKPLFDLAARHAGQKLTELTDRLIRKHIEDSPELREEAERRGLLKPEPTAA